MNYYELLQVSPSASAEVIKNAYKTLAKKYHPDIYGGDHSFAEEKMKLLNEAIAVLEDETKRKEYNEENHIITEDYMKDIDAFLRVNGEKPSAQSAKEESDNNYTSILKDIKDIETFDINTNIDLYDEENDIKTSKKTKNKKNKRSKKQKIGRWYYIVIISLVAANVLAVFLIANTFSTDLIKSFFGRGENTENTEFTVSEESSGDYDDEDDNIFIPDEKDDGSVIIPSTEETSATEPFIETETTSSETTETTSSQLTATTTKTVTPTQTTRQQVQPTTTRTTVATTRPPATTNKPVATTQPPATTAKPAETTEATTESATEPTADTEQPTENTTEQEQLPVEPTSVDAESEETEVTTTEAETKTTEPPFVTEYIEEAEKTEEPESYEE